MVGINKSVRIASVSIRLILTQNNNKRPICPKTTKVNRKAKNPPLKELGNLEKFTSIPFSKPMNKRATATIAAQKVNVICENSKKLVIFKWKLQKRGVGCVQKGICGQSKAMERNRHRLKEHSSRVWRN